MFKGISRQTILVTLGYAAFLVCMTGSRVTSSLGADYGFSMSTVYARFATTCVCVFGGVLSFRFMKAFRVLCPVGFLIFSFAGLAFWRMGYGNDAASSLVLGTGIGFGYLTWGYLYARCNPNDFIWQMVAIRLVWGAVGVPISAFDSQDARSLLLLPLIVLDAALAIAAMRGTKASGGNGKSVREATLLSGFAFLRASAHSTWKIVLFTCVLAASSGVLRIFVGNAGASGVWLGVERFACAVVGSLCLWVYYLYRGRYSSAAVFFVPFLLAASMFFVLPAVLPEYRIVLHIVVDSIYIAGCMFMSVACAHVSQQDEKSGMLVFGVAQGLVNLFISLGFLPSLFAVNGNMGSSFGIFTMSMSIIYLIAIATVVIALLRKSDDEQRKGGGRPLKMYVTISEESIRSNKELVDVRKLSDREMDVLILALTGRSASAIGETLFVSEGTVKTHLKHIYRKLDVHNRNELRVLIENLVEQNA